MSLQPNGKTRREIVIIDAMVVVQKLNPLTPSKMLQRYVRNVFKKDK